MKLRKLIDLWLFLFKVIKEKGGPSKFMYKGIKFFINHNQKDIKEFLVYSVNSIQRNNYKKWIKRYDTYTPEHGKTYKSRIESFERKPKISVILPVYNPKITWLIEAVQSVIDQIYPYWELCIADDCSTDPEIRKVLEGFAAKDSRIKVCFREVNGHISAASNSALKLASGDWIALLDHDDVLALDALYWVAKSIISNPEARLIYSDEDKIDSKGIRSNPYFKSDWNPDLFYSHNLITHLGVYEIETVHEINGFRVGFEGAQDYDLALRFIERIEVSQIVHIPRILYHWRIHENSTAESNASKPYAAVAGEKALNEHFERMGMASSVEFLPEGYGYRAHHSIPVPFPVVDIIIPTKNNKDYLEKCITSILNKTKYTNYRINIIDNNSTEESVFTFYDLVNRNDKITIQYDRSPFNFSAINNRAVEQVSGDIVLFLNDDTEVINPDWLLEMVSHAVRKDIGAVGARLWYENDKIQHAGIICGLNGLAGHAHLNLPKNLPGYIARAALIQNFSAVTAACLAIRKQVFLEVGGFDEENFGIAYNDVDLCLKVLHKGYRNIWTPYAELYHYESVSRGYEDTPDKIKRFETEKKNLRLKWGDFLQSDPAYNPNLTHEFDDFSLAWPPRF